MREANNRQSARRHCKTTPSSLQSSNLFTLPSKYFENPIECTYNVSKTYCDFTTAAKQRKAAKDEVYRNFGIFLTFVVFMGKKPTNQVGKQITHKLVCYLLICFECTLKVREENLSEILRFFRVGKKNSG